MKKVLSSLGIALGVGIVVYGYLQFMRLSLETPNALEELPGTVQGLVVVRHPETWSTWATDDSMPEIAQLLKSDIALWASWMEESESYREWLGNQPLYFVITGDQGEQGYWMVGIPEKWNSEERKVALARWGGSVERNGVLIWSRGNAPLDFTTATSEQVNRYMEACTSLSPESSLAVVLHPDQDTYALEWRKSQWWGAAQFLAKPAWDQGEPIPAAVRWRSSMNQGTRLVFKDALQDTVWKSSVSLFSSDTLCQCESAEAWTRWMNGEAVLYSQGQHYLWELGANTSPWKSISSFVRDTTAGAHALKLNQPIQALSFGKAKADWKWVAYHNKNLLISDDSLLMQQALKDTLTLTFGERDSLEYSNPLWMKFSSTGSMSGPMQLLQTRQPMQWAYYGSVNGKYVVCGSVK
jgi:hypothetical protein